MTFAGSWSVALHQITNITALSMIQVESINLVHHCDSRRQGSHRRSERRSRHCKIIGICARRGLEEVRSGRVSWDDRIMQPPNKRSNAIPKRKPLAGQPCLVLQLSLQTQPPCCCPHKLIATIRPLSSTSEDLGMKTVLLAVNCAGNSATLKHKFKHIKQELRTQPCRTPVDTL